MKTITKKNNFSSERNTNNTFKNSVKILRRNEIVIKVKKNKKPSLVFMCENYGKLKIGNKEIGLYEVGSGGILINFDKNKQTEQYEVLFSSIFNEIGKLREQNKNN